ncbi:unnamed protein product [Effrenium voratum]|uniref:Uncharacterized protein n=1 Tax=Effrenium voratum TaxID=2562239 RepID=A0AA36NE44_9DINO|nr:unnamed protein product [Effrenium voratum]
MGRAGDEHLLPLLDRDREWRLGLLPAFVCIGCRKRSDAVACRCRAPRLGVTMKLRETSLFPGKSAQYLFPAKSTLTLSPHVSTSRLAKLLFYSRGGHHPEAQSRVCYL